MGNQPDKSFCGQLLSACGDRLICALIHIFSLFAWKLEFLTYFEEQRRLKKICNLYERLYLCFKLNWKVRVYQIKFEHKLYWIAATCSVTNGAGRPAWRPHLEQICVWQTFGLLTTQRQGPSCSTGVCQLSTQMGLWESLAWCLLKSWCNASVLVIDASTVTEAIFTEM